MNHMITGDDGSSPASPYYRVPEPQCQNCRGHWHEEDLTTIKYDPVGLDEDAEADPIEVTICPRCVKSFKNNPNIVIL